MSSKHEFSSKYIGTQHEDVNDTSSLSISW